MVKTRITRRLVTAGIWIGVAVPAVASAYDTRDAIRDCENRIRSEYGIGDLRDAQAEQIMDGDKHFKVRGLAKVDNKKHPWTCEIKARHVVAAEYSGPKPEGMSTAQKLAVGAAAAVAVGIAASEMSQHGGSSGSVTGAAGLQDLVGARGSSGEMALTDRGYRNVGGTKEGGSSYTTWLKGSSCVMVRTADGRYRSIVDAPMADCR